MGDFYKKENLDKTNEKINNIKTNQDSKDMLEILKFQQDEYFRRLDSIIKDNNKNTRLRTICITIGIIVWLIGYFCTPYLTRNYAKIETGTGTIIQTTGGDE